MTTGSINYSPDYKSEPQSATATKTEMRNGALAHYEKVSSAAHEWHSAIPKAIVAYYEDPTERARLESEALEHLLAWHCEKDPSKRSAAWHRMLSATNDLALFREVNGIG